MAWVATQPPPPPSPHDSLPSPSRPPPSTSSLDEVPPVRPYATLLRLGLQPLIVHFHPSNNGYIDPTTLDQFDTKIFSRILRETVHNFKAREELALSGDVWLDLRDAFCAGGSCLTLLSCTRIAVGEQGTQSPADDEEVASSSLIVKNCYALSKDAGRLTTLTGIARNLLTVGREAQDLAASRHVRIEESIFSLINLCVRITGRGFDTASSKDDERKWQGVVNEFKRLLATCLQVLNNLSAQNERRKLGLWMGLFAEESLGSTVDGGVPGGVETKLVEGLRDAVGDLAERSIGDIARVREGLMEHMRRLEETRLRSSGGGSTAGRKVGATQQEQPVLGSKGLSSSPFLLYIGRVGMDIKKELQESGVPAGATEIAAECKRRWQAMSPADQHAWHEYYTQVLASYREEVKARDSGEDVGKRDPELASSIEQMQGDFKALEMGAEIDERVAAMRQERAQQDYKKWNSMDTTPTEEDYRVTYSASYGAAILQQGKEDLLRRLEPDRLRAMRSHRARTRSPPPPPPSGAAELPPRSTSQPTVAEAADAPLCLASDDGQEPISSSASNSSYDDPSNGDDGRGILTDVPLILGPNEIEVLPMIIQSGICPPLPDAPGYGATEEENEALRSMCSLRCQILLAREEGRNLLRELLIFIAAWDLREEELYFGIMGRIIEAILQEGLVPWCYWVFREGKDVISPAQAVIMKLLTHIFRRRQADHAAANNNRRGNGLAIFPNKTPPPPPSSSSQQQQTSSSSALPQPSTPPYPTAADVRLVSHLLTEFRRHIIPQTCALIFLQGQIHRGLVSHEEFPLNLWDMERMYEGVYQYLEFFAVLTEGGEWKGMMAAWGVSHELVTLLEELEAGVPRGNMARDGAGRRASRRGNVGSGVGGEAVGGGVQAEIPYETGTQLPLLQGHQQGEQQTLPPPPPPPIEDEPSDFEWRNLKKLAVLVLSSLVWKNPMVQEQLGAAGPVPSWDNHAEGDTAAGASPSTSTSGAPSSGGAGEKGRGIRALLNCCKVDDCNPYIREHAIMALRFALENNPENQKIVRSLEKIGLDPSSVSPPPPASGIATLSQQPSTGTGQRATVTTATGVKVEVPREVLDLNGYETFVDGRGQVQLKKKRVGATQAGGSSIVSGGGGGGREQVVRRPDVFEGEDDGLEEGDFM